MTTTALQLQLKTPNTHYVNQRAPLTPSPVQKLPPGAVKPTSWLKTQLDLQTKGFSGRLSEISRFLDPKDNAWMGTGDSQKAGWEEVPYWLRGQTALAYVTGDKKLIAEVKPWIESVLKSQQPDGWLGPVGNRDTKFGTPDLWPNCLMQAVLQTYYEATKDKRVLTAMNRYMGFLSNLPDEKLFDPRHYWHYHRVADQLASLVWLYNHTGDKALLPLADRFHKASSDWVGGIPNYHGVNFAQGFREPATYSLFSKNPEHWAATERDLKAMRDEFGQAPGGLYAADENARKGYTDPRQAVESCTVAEMMLSDELLFRYSGDPVWMDRLEEVVYNWLPATMTADLKCLRYLQSPNLAVSDAAPKSPGVENGGPMFLLDPNDHRCCQHNLGMAWPYFVESLWLATNDNGLMAAAYAPSTVTARVGKGAIVTIEETGSYPFDDSVVFKIKTESKVKFPLSLRIPSWADGYEVSVNGTVVADFTGRSGKPGFVTIHREWADGDQVKSKFGMPLNVVEWSHPQKGVSFMRGPLAFSLQIGEESKQHSRPSGWNAVELFPTTAWNYASISGAKIELERVPFGVTNSKKPSDMPNIFTENEVPVRLKTKMKRVPEWILDMYGLVAPMQASPVKTSEPEETVTLIPMGAARLRMTVFPIAGEGGAGNVWTKPRSARKPIPTTYSHRNWWDNENACSDGLLPSGPDDETIPRFTWWDHKGTEEWVAYTFEAERTFQKCRVWWFDDTGKGGCRPPKSWKIQVKTGGIWRDVEVSAQDESTISFRPVGGREIRLLVQLQEGFSAGILEWEVE